jgi:hypothetical protein
MRDGVGALQQGAPFLTIGQQFLSSDEFYNRAAQQGSKACGSTEAKRDGSALVCMVPTRLHQKPRPLYNLRVGRAMN